MSDFDKQAYADTVEYYRLTLALHKQDPHAAETVKADEAILAMVKKTPDMVEMNKQFMEGGLSFALARGMAVDGANYQAEVYEELEEAPLAEQWRARAAALAAARDYNEIYDITGRMDAAEAPVKENEARLKQLVQTVIEKIPLVYASPPGTDRDEQPKGTMVANLDELKQRFPGTRFPDLLRLPRIRKRLFYPDDKFKALIAAFEKVNKERLGGRY